MAPEPGSLEAFFTSRADRSQLARLDVAAVPAHVAIIMDGNGRWASKRGMPRSLGHKAGARSVRETIATALELGIRYLTIFSFSSENWRRPADEVDGLMELFVEVLSHEVDNLIEHGVQVKVIGSARGVPAGTMAAFRSAEERTRGCSTMTLIVALNYGGRMEIVEAVRAIASKVRDGALDADGINEDVFSAHLYTEGIPDPDLLIRTSGEYRLSNFLLWQMAYTEFYFTDILWPDFREEQLIEAISGYQKRERRFGLTSDQVQKRA